MVQRHPEVALKPGISGCLDLKMRRLPISLVSVVVRGSNGTVCEYYENALNRNISTILPEFDLIRTSYPLTPNPQYQNNKPQNRRTTASEAKNQSHLPYPIFPCTNLTLGFENEKAKGLSGKSA